jgi:uncharacterized repeat protein (TIGR01451 family)
VSAQVTDPNSANNDAQAVTLVDFADLSLTKTDAPDPVVAGNDVAYSMNLTNNTGSGGGTAQNVTVADSVPAHTTFVLLTPPSGWSCTTPSAGGTGAISCTNPSVPLGGAATFTLVVHVDPGTPNDTVLTNTASVTSATGDQNPGNNTATATTTVGPSADLAVTKTAPATRPNQSDLTYGMTVTNNGVSPTRCPPAKRSSRSARRPDGRALRPASAALELSTAAPPRSPAARRPASCWSSTSLPTRGAS